LFLPDGCSFDVISAVAQGSKISHEASYVPGSGASCGSA
jgi:hypothetical protein